MKVDNQPEAFEYMRNVMMLGAGEHGYRKFSLAWESESDKDTPRACRLADFTGVSYLVKGNWIDDEFLKWVDRSQPLGDDSVSFGVTLWAAMLQSNMALMYLDDVEMMSDRKYIISRIYKALGVDSGLEYIRRRVTFCDGEEMSIQASKEHHCHPQDDDGPYRSVEIGFPTFVDPRLIPYAMDEDDPLDTTYRYVPVNILGKVIREHGGVLEGELPPMKGLR